MSLCIEVAVALAGGEVAVQRIELTDRVTAGEAAALAVARLGPDKDLAWPAAAAERLAVFGQHVGPDYRLTEGDRLEICRPLTVDPKEIRRRRAALRARGR